MARMWPNSGQCERDFPPKKSSSGTGTFPRWILKVCVGISTRSSPRVSVFFEVDPAGPGLDRSVPEKLIGIIREIVISDPPRDQELAA